mmetsp:Transcript_30535/g.79210  ORF Transcript_30535/g.79210 Transcript_30535/m.79210 type:complete len:84 (+) Transcript_30535:2715-2966(+)
MWKELKRKVYLVVVVAMFFYWSRAWLRRFSSPVIGRSRASGWMLEQTVGLDRRGSVNQWREGRHNENEWWKVSAIQASVPKSG